MNYLVFCYRYGSDLVLIESYTENNYTASLARRSLGPAQKNNQKYWLGLASLDDLRTNTLEYAGGVLVSQYSGKLKKFKLFIPIPKLFEFSELTGFWSLSQPDPSSGECVDVTVTDEQQSWELQTCESLLPFLCRANACPTGWIVYYS